MLSIQNQLEAAYVGQDISLECHTEAYPTSINYWTTEKGDMIVSGESGGQAGGGGCIPAPGRRVQELYFFSVLI